jgi:hypothetical protein
MPSSSLDLADIKRAEQEGTPNLLYAAMLTEVFPVR